MKPIVFLASFVLIKSMAFANSNAGSALLFNVALIGGTMNASSQSYYGGLPIDLQDWSNPQSQVTSELSAQCGVLTEMKIVRTTRANLLFIAVRNDSKNDLLIKVDRIKAQFSNGRERFLLASPNQNTIEIKKGWYGWGFIPFPSKSDFQSQSALSIAVPLILNGENLCTMQSTFQRNKDVPEDPDSYSEAPAFMFSMGFGAPIIRTSSLNSTINAAKPYNLDFMLSGFNKPSRGSYWQFSAGKLGEVKDSSVFGSKAYATSNMLDTSIGKTWRYFYSHKSYGYLNLGPSLTSLEAFTDNKGNGNNSIMGVGIYASYTYDWLYLKSNIGPDQVDYFLGLTAYAKFYPYYSDSKLKNFGMIGLTLELLRFGL